jgi:hypothetical protein
MCTLPTGGRMCGEDCSETSKSPQIRTASISRLELSRKFSFEILSKLGLLSGNRKIKVSGCNELDLSTPGWSVLTNFGKRNVEFFSSEFFFWALRSSNFHAIPRQFHIICRFAIHQWVAGNCISIISEQFRNNLAKYTIFS